MTIVDGILLRICRGPSCGPHADALFQAARAYIDQQGLAEVVGLAEAFCFGACRSGPSVLVERRRDGQRNERALISIALNHKHPDMALELGVRPGDLPKLIEHYRRRMGS